MSAYRVAKFWIRPVAFLIDVLLLVAIGFVLGVLFKEFFISLKSNGIFIGFLISLLYFTLCNSKFCKGQTLGQFIFRITVLDSNDGYLPLWKSLIRSLVLTIPLFFLNYQIPGLSASSIISDVIFNLLLFILIGFAYFYVFNRSTRQTIHDFVVNSFVVSFKKETEGIERQHVKPLVYYLYLSISIALIIVFVIFSPSRIYSKKYPEKASVPSKLNQIENISKCNLTLGIFKSFDLESSKTYIVLSCDIYVIHEIDDNPESLENNDLVKEAIGIILENYPDLHDVNSIKVSINRDFNIGIYRSNQKVKVGKTPTEWMDFLVIPNDID
jgi:uncharacterized RDD family membrane protein YckC